MNYICQNNKDWSTKIWRRAPSSSVVPAHATTSPPRLLAISVVIELDPKPSLLRRKLNLHLLYPLRRELWLFYMWNATTQAWSSCGYVVRTKNKPKDSTCLRKRLFATIVAACKRCVPKAKSASRKLNIYNLQLLVVGDGAGYTTRK